MFIAIYEFDVKTGHEQEFIAAWLQLTKGIHEHHGSLGSRLHRDKNGRFIGYAQWPDRATWERDWPAEDLLAAPRTRMRSCLNGSNTIYEAEVVADYLQDSLSNAP